MWSLYSEVWRNFKIVVILIDVKSDFWEHLFDYENGLYYFNSFMTEVYHIEETSPLICRASRWIGFCVAGTSVMKDWIRLTVWYYWEQWGSSRELIKQAVYCPNLQSLVSVPLKSSAENSIKLNEKHKVEPYLPATLLKRDSIAIVFL